VNRRSFLGLIPLFSVAAAFPKKLLASVYPRYLECMTDVRCEWETEELTSESHRVKLFADRDRNRIGVYSNSGNNIFVWELPLSDVEKFFKGKTTKTDRGAHTLWQMTADTTMTCRYENFTEQYANSFKATIGLCDDKLRVNFFGHNPNENAHCEINKKDVDFLLTKTKA
jgi:hypothetical protein